MQASLEDFVKWRDQDYIRWIVNNEWNNAATGTLCDLFKCNQKFWYLKMIILGRPFLRLMRFQMMI